MNTSSEFIAELAAADEFVSHVRRLTSKQLRALARRVEDVRPTTAGDIDWWRATAAVSRRLRHVRGSPGQTPPEGWATSSSWRSNAAGGT